MCLGMRSAFVHACALECEVHSCIQACALECEAHSCTHACVVECEVHSCIHACVLECEVRAHACVLDVRALEDERAASVHARVDTREPTCVQECMRACVGGVF